MIVMYCQNLLKLKVNPVLILLFPLKRTRYENTVKHLYLDGIFIGTLVVKRKHRQNTRPRNTVSNSVAQ